MKIKELKNELLGESYFNIDHPSGLKLLLFPKKKYASTYALFATKYGSIDTRIEAQNGSFYDIPEGTAHFLEHKLFESEDLDAFERFAKTGASANAYTSFDKTAYLFSCSDNFNENLEILLDFVQSPYFTSETVLKEQGIIGQEIRMYRDVPDWEVMFNLLRILYRKHPVRIDIAGTEESIAQITADTLYDCYRNFYTLGNMVLAVAGNFETQEVISIVDRLAKQPKGKAAKREFVPESPIPINSYIEETLAVAMPQFMLGYKEDIKTPERTEKERIESEILLEIIAGKSSQLYKDLLDEELINTGFSSEYFEGFGYSAFLMGGTSANPVEAEKRIRKYIKELKESGISEADFERARRKYYGRLVMMFNDVDDIANTLVSKHFVNGEIFADADIIKSLTLSDINERFSQVFDDRYCALSVIKGEE